MSYKKDPRQIYCKFDSVCAETSKPISKGEECIYYPKGKKVYHLKSKQATEFREWKQDQIMGHEY